MVAIGQRNAGLLAPVAWPGATHRNTRGKESSVNTALVKTVRDEAMAIDGALGACLVDCTSGMCLGTAGGQGLNLEVAAACSTEVVKAQMRTMSQLGVRDRIEDMLITLGSQYHLIRMVNGAS